MGWVGGQLHGRKGQDTVLLQPPCPHQQPHEITSKCPGVVLTVQRAPQGQRGQRQQTQAVPTQNAPALDPDLRWHVGEEAPGKLQGCGAWGLVLSQEAPQACGTEGRAGSSAVTLSRVKC